MIHKQKRTILFFTQVFFLNGGFCIASLGFCKDISVTAVKVSGNQAEITINNVLVVKEIQVSREGGLGLKYPEFVSQSGRIYPQIRIVSQQADKAIKQAIQTEKLVGPIVDWNFEKDLKLVKLEKHRKKPMYFATVSFDDAIEVDCKFMRRDDGSIKVLWPARPPAQEGGAWVNQIYFSKRAIREIAEKPLIEKFLKQEKELLSTPVSGKNKSLPQVDKKKEEEKTKKLEQAQEEE